MQGKQEDAILEILKTKLGGGFRVTGQKSANLFLVDWNETTNSQINEDKLEVTLKDFNFDTIKFKTKENFESYIAQRKAMLQETV